MIVIPILVLCGVVVGFVIGCFDDGPAIGLGMSFVGAIIGGIIGLCIATIAGVLPL